MVNCAYKNEQSQCSHKNVHTSLQIVTDKVCNNCPFKSRQIDPSKLRPTLPEVKEVITSNPNFPDPPGVVEMGVNFIKSATKHIMNGAENVSSEVYKERIEICNSCEYRQGTACSLCGCNLARKLRWKSNSCPLNPPKWGPIN